MKWPRGKHNGRRIVGVSFKIAIAVTCWHWKPFMYKCGPLYVHWLCVETWTELVYE